MAIALIPGTFDPVTFGHLDIVERAARQFDEVVVAVVAAPAKSGVLFDAEERRAMLAEVTASLPNVEVEIFGGLLADYALARGATAIVKGLRAVSDFEYELQIAQMNAALAPGLDTVFVTATPASAFLSSSLVKEVARYGGPTEGLVPSVVAKALAERFSTP